MPRRSVSSTGERPLFKVLYINKRENSQLFDESGRVLRARVTLSLKQYKPVEVQRRDLKLSSPDRTRVRVLREGETLASLRERSLWQSRYVEVDRPKPMTLIGHDLSPPVPS